MAPLISVSNKWVVMPLTEEIRKVTCVCVKDRDTPTPTPPPTYIYLFRERFIYKFWTYGFKACFWIYKWKCSVEVLVVLRREV